MDFVTQFLNGAFTRAWYPVNRRNADWSADIGMEPFAQGPKVRVAFPVML
jgi:hypothetical protein